MNYLQSFYVQYIYIYILIYDRAAEQAQALHHQMLEKNNLLNSTIQSIDSDFMIDIIVYNLAKTYFDTKEYHRAAKVLQNCKSRKAVCLRLYATYLVRTDLFN